jgi:hypothetical protein
MQAQHSHPENANLRWGAHPVMEFLTNFACALQWKQSDDKQTLHIRVSLPQQTETKALHTVPFHLKILRAAHDAQQKYISPSAVRDEML